MVISQHVIYYKVFMEHWEYLRGLCYGGIAKIPIHQSLETTLSDQDTLLELGLWGWETRFFSQGAHALLG
jgi:hypothetical protein